MEQQAVARTTVVEKPAQGSATREPAREHAREPCLGLFHRSIGNRAVGRLLQTKLAGPARDRYQQEVAQQQFPPNRIRAGTNENVCIQRQCSCAPPADCGGSESHEHEGRIQTKLAISAPGDRYEQEADQVADYITQAPGHSFEIPIATGMLDVQAGMIAFARHPTISPLSSDGLATVGAASSALETVENRLPQLETGGSPLPESFRYQMESRFGYDFSSIRVHHDSESARLNETLESLAFTRGRNIFFSPGAYRPNTTDGDRLLAHELTHVVQQSGGSSGGAVGGPAAIQCFDEFKIRGTPFHAEIEDRFRKKNPNLITEAKVPGGTTNKKELDAVGRPDFYEGLPARVMPGVKGNYAKDDPDKRTLKYSKLAQNSAKSAGATSSSPQVLTGDAFSGDFPNIFVGDLKPWLLKSSLPAN